MLRVWRHRILVIVFVRSLLDEPGLRSCVWTVFAARPWPPRQIGIPEAWSCWRWSRCSGSWAGCQEQSKLLDTWKQAEIKPPSEKSADDAALLGLE